MDHGKRLSYCLFVLVWFIFSGFVIAGDKKTQTPIIYECSNHGQTHTGKAKELKKLTKEHGCKGWKAVRKKSPDKDQELSISFECSNHDPSHTGQAKELKELTKEHGCTGWKTIDN